MRSGSKWPMIGPLPCAYAGAYVDPVFTSQSYDISTSTRTNLSVFLVLMLMLMSTQSSLAYTCACAYAYACALVKNRLKQRRRRRQRERQKSKGFRSAKQQLCTFIKLFYTFLCRYCTTTTWKCLISRSVENANTRQQLYFSFAELWDSLLEFNSRKNCQHLTNWTRWKKRDKVWKSATVLFKWRFRSRIRKLPNINFVRRPILWSAFCLRTVVKDAYLPPHLYGQLVQKKSGFKLLQKTVSSMFLLSGCFGFAHFASQ